tara:strand:- start:889 stop:1098 length:210 start_codon:yes stop_codon:yes gene_type:complete
MNIQSVYILKDRGILYVNGGDAKEFLQNIISNNINKVDEEVKPSNNLTFFIVLKPFGSPVAPDLSSFLN